MKCSDCNVEMSVWCKDVFNYNIGWQNRDVPFWVCPECGKEVPYVEVNDE